MYCPALLGVFGVNRDEFHHLVRFVVYNRFKRATVWRVKLKPPNNAVLIFAAPREPHKIDPALLDCPDNAPCQLLGADTM